MEMVLDTHGYVFFSRYNIYMSYISFLMFPSTINILFEFKTVISTVERKIFINHPRNPTKPTIKIFGSTFQYHLIYS